MMSTETYAALIGAAAICHSIYTAAGHKARAAPWLVVIVILGTIMFVRSLSNG